MAGNVQPAEAMTNAWFTGDKLPALANRHAMLNLTGNRRGTWALCQVG
jgi:hypothetical protein